MISQKLTFSLILAAALTLANLAMASGLEHPDNSERGYTYHPEHIGSTVAQTQVLEELKVAKKDGSYNAMKFGLQTPSERAGVAKTREQVLRELKNMTPEEKKQRDEMLRGD